MSDWKEYKLAKVCDFISGYAFKSNDFGNFSNKVIRIGDIKPPFVDVDGATGVNLDNYDLHKLSKYEIKHGDFILAMTGATIGKIGKYLSKENSYINQRVLLFNPKVNIDSQFLYYAVLTKDFYSYIINHIDSESAQPNISAGTIGKYIFAIPPLTEQKKIAGILSALDEKIETNRKINARLEEMAQAIFKSWFIEFTPFGGQMPEDWELKPIDEVYSIKYGKNISKSELSDNGYPVYGANGIIGFTDKYNVNKIVTLITSRGNGSGEVSYTRDKYAFITNNSFIISPQSYYKYLSFPYIYQSFLRIDFKSLCSGSAQPQLTNTSISSLSIRIPTKDIIDKFTQLCGAFYEKIFSLYKESSRLAGIRDTFLPKLMSGEIKVH